MGIEKKPSGFLVIREQKLFDTCFIMEWSFQYIISQIFLNANYSKEICLLDIKKNIRENLSEHLRYQRITAHRVHSNPTFFENVSCKIKKRESYNLILYNKLIRHFHNVTFKYY